MHNKIRAVFACSAYDILTEIKLLGNNIHLCTETYCERESIMFICILALLIYMLNLAKFADYTLNMSHSEFNVKWQIFALKLSVHARKLSERELTLKTSADKFVM